MKLINKNTPYNDRREIIIVDKDNLPKNAIDKKKAGSYIFGGIYKVSYDLLIGKNIEEQIRNLVRDEFKMSCLPIQSVEGFRFSKQPVCKELYIALKEIPDFYFNLNNIHEQILKCKMEAFLDFCSSLGVKEARIVSDKEIKNQNGFNVEVPINESIGIGSKSSIEKISKKYIQKSFSFPKPKYKLHKCENEFYKLEPDWIKIEKLRLDSLKDISKAEIKIKKYHEFNLSVDIKASIANKNINLGFNNNEVTNDTFIYEIVFWEKE